VTFTGVGNLQAQAKSTVKPKSKTKPKRCRKGFTKRHGRCVKNARKGKAGKAGAHARKTGKRSSRGRK
jgi:hypothetical protein